MNDFWKAFAVAAAFLFVCGLNGCSSHGERERSVGAKDDLSAQEAAVAKAPEAEPSGRPAAERNAEAEPDLWFESPEALTRYVLQGLRQKDLKGLNRARVTKKMYTETIWPRFPASQNPKNTIPADFHWFMLDKNSVKGVMRIVNEYGGRQWGFVSLQPERVEEYETYKLWRKVKVTIKENTTQTERTVQLFGSMVELDGRFKLLAYL